MPGIHNHSPEEHDRINNEIEEQLLKEMDDREKGLLVDKQRKQFLTIPFFISLGIALFFLYQMFKNFF